MHILYAFLCSFTCMYADRYNYKYPNQSPNSRLLLFLHSEKMESRGANLLSGRGRTPQQTTPPQLPYAKKAAFHLREATRDTQLLYILKSDFIYLLCAKYFTLRREKDTEKNSSILKWIKDCWKP